MENQIIDGLEFVYMGDVAVDSGQLAIADPSYWSDKRLSEDAQIQAREESDDPIYELGILDNVDASMAIVFATKFGDGMHKVFTVWDKEELKGFYVSAGSNYLNDGI